jgi:hypothetical protein
MRNRPDKKDRLGSIRDLDAAAMVLRQASCAVLLDDGTPDRAVRKTGYSDLLPR